MKNKDRRWTVINITTEQEEKVEQKHHGNSGVSDVAQEGCLLNFPFPEQQATVARVRRLFLLLVLVYLGWKLKDQSTTMALG